MCIRDRLGAGGSAYAAIKLGEKKEREAEITLSNVFVLLIGVGVVLTILGLVFLEPILRLFGATDKIMPFAWDYSFVIILGIPFNMLGVGLSNLARTDGAPKLSMYSMLAGAALNTILDPIFIFGFGWGVTGAAIATVLSQVVSAAVLICYFWKKGNMRFHRRDMRLHPRICGVVAALGISSCITQLASTLLQIVMNLSLIHI